MNSSLATFQEVIDDYSSRYAYNSTENIDWNAVFSNNSYRFTENMTSSQTAEAIFESLYFLGNEHFYVKSADGVYYSQVSSALQNGDIGVNYIQSNAGQVDAAKLSQYAMSGFNTSIPGITHALLKNNIGYIQINSFSQNFVTSISQETIDAMFSQYQSCVGIIIDNRKNSGGVVNVQDMITKYILNENLTYAYYDKDWNGSLDPSIAEIDSTKFLDKPIVGLIGNNTFSQAELFSKAMSLSSNITLIGDTTYGPEGRGETITLSNGIMYSIPLQISYWGDMSSAKGNGVNPDIKVDANHSFSSNSDFLIEMAMLKILDDNGTEINVDFGTPENGIATISNDTIAASTNSDFIDGLEGIDSYILNGAMSSYEIAIDTHLSVIKLLDITHSLTNIERIQFADSVLALDTDGIAGKAYRIYQAAFDRTPDEEGLGYWISEMDKGMSLEGVSNSFIHSQEFQGLYGANPTNETFVTLLYNNVLNRDPDAAGMEYWLNELHVGIIDKSGALASFSESTENINNVADVIANGIEYAPYDIFVG